VRSEVNPPLVKFLKTEKAKKGRLTVAVTDNQAQKLAWRTPGVNYHWVYNTTTSDDIEILVDQLKIDYLVVTNAPKRNRFLLDDHWSKTHFDRLPEKLGGVWIYVPRPRG